LNSKFFVFLTFVIFIFGCGVKAKPFKRPETAIKSYIDPYLRNPEQETEKTKNPLETTK
jgi:hypothetical protein